MGSRRIAGTSPRRFRLAYSLVEVLVAMGVGGVIFASIFSGISFAMARVQNSRESAVATQIIIERLDTIRLYAWDKLMTPGYVPTTFTSPFSPADSGLSALGFTSDPRLYYGTTTITTNLTMFDPSYRSNICIVTVSLAWTNGRAPRSASMTTLVTKNGLQTYVY